MSLLAFAGIIFVLVYFVAASLMEKISLANYQIQEDMMKQEIIEQHINELPRIQKQYEAIEKSGDLSGVLLDKERAVVLIENLERLAERTGNTILIGVQEVDSKKVVAKSKTSTEGELLEKLPSKDYLQLKITLTGSYNSLVQFVKSIESFQYYGDIVSMRIDGDMGSSASVQASFDSKATNPFSVGEAGDISKIAKKEKGELTSSLEVVFYTKKN